MFVSFVIFLRSVTVEKRHSKIGIEVKLFGEIEYNYREKSKRRFLRCISQLKLYNWKKNHSGGIEIHKVRPQSSSKSQKNGYVSFIDFYVFYGVDGIFEF